MRKGILLFAFFLACLFAAAQTVAESEPNNSFATANTLPVSDTLTAVVGGADVIDYFKPNLAFWAGYGYETGSIIMSVTATNTGSSAASLKAEMFNGLQASGLVYSNNIGTNVAPGATVSGEIRICGQALDDFFLAMTTNGTFSYRIRSYFSDPNPNSEPNDLRSAATLISFDTLNAQRQAINYLYRQNPYTDTVDYLKTYLPPGNYTDVSLEIKAKNNSCLNGKGIQYAAYRNNSATPFATGYVGSNPYVATFTEVVTSLSLDAVQGGDSLFIKIWSDAAFGYELKYTVDRATFVYEDYDDDPYGDYPEPLGENATVSAQVGYHMYQNEEPVYDDDGYPVLDDYDTYEFTLPQDGQVTLYATGLNDACGDGLRFDLLDQYGNSVSNFDYQTLLAWNYNTCNTQQSTVKIIRAFTAGTYRLRIHSSAGNDYRTSYTLRYSFQAYNSGGSDDAEQNSSQATALPIAAQQTKKGYLHFKPATYDYTDYYKSPLSVESSLKVYMKATYRGGTATRTNNNSLTFTCSNTAFTRRIPLAATTVVSDAAYLDTFTVASVPQGTAYFYVYSDSAYEYEFHYEVIDTLGGPNDAEPNNNFNQVQPFALSDTVQGRIGYTANGTTDTYDYFRTVLPKDGKLKIFIQAKNTGLNQQYGFDWLNATVYDGGSGRLLEKHLTGNNDIPIGTTVYDTLTLCGVARDTVYFGLYAPQKFRYSFRMELQDTTTDYFEPNNSLAQALKLKASTTYPGTVGYTSRGATDIIDYYKVVFGSSDVLKVKLQATNYGCGADALQLNVYNKNGSSLLSRNVGNNNALAVGQAVADSFALPVTGIDTLYIRLFSYSAFGYSLTTGPLVPASLFSVAGDTAVCLGTQVYKALNITDSGFTPHWTLPDGGGTITGYTDSTATINWTQPGIRTVQLFLSNSAGNSQPRKLSVVVNGAAPTQVPVAYNFARTLSTALLPLAAHCQWYKNGVAIAGATDSVYYAADAGSFTVAFVNTCGPGPQSNAIAFPAPAQAQTIAFPHTAALVMSPTARVVLNATASSGLPVFYQKISGPATLLNDTLFITGAGTLIVKATQPGDDVYSAATPRYDTITVVKGSQAITFDSIPAKIYVPSGSFLLGATSSSGLGVSYTIVSGNAALSYYGESLIMTAAGAVTVRASQPGSQNYNAAMPVERSFCIGVRTLTAIAGDAAPCLATYRYTTQKIPGANFIWSLSGGGILTTHNDTAWVQWQTAGTHTLKVKANTACDTVWTTEQVLTIATSDNAPVAVTGMQPANGTANGQLPLTLSWIPGAHTVSYDLYVWDSTAVRPATPYAAALTTVSYELPKASFAYNKAYKWQVVAKNPCSQTAGPVQSFRLIPLPDLVVSNVQAPAAVNSGQTVTISWKVTNAGPGRTITGQKWTDAVFFSFDTMPNFRANLNWDPALWTNLVNTPQPLLAGSKVNTTALDSGQSYTASISFTLPVQYNFPLYVYVMADYNTTDASPLQVTRANDTLRAASPINVTLAPTPDLRVDSVFTPVSAFSGSTINVTYKVKNYGVVTPVGQDWTDSVFISQDPLFSREASLPLTIPKANGSYYPNAAHSFAYNSGQLNAGATVTKSIQAVIPNFIVGTWFVYVKTNAAEKDGNFVYEGSLAGNNVNRSQLQVYLTPTPKLTVSTLSVPVTAASTTQPLGVNWIIANEGLTDNGERAKGHYLYKVVGSCPCYLPPGSPPNSVCVPPPKYADSLAQGSSYWLDRVYLSTDSSGLNAANALLLSEVAHGVQPFPGLRYPDDLSGCDYGYGKYNVETPLYPGSAFPSGTSFRMPSDLAPGNYYLYVYTNPTKTVFEYPGTPQIRRSALPIAVSRPDAVVSAIAAPAAATGGQTISISYAVTNNGPGTVFNHQRKDRLYISNFPAFDASAQLLSTQTFTEDLLVGTAVPHSFGYKLPAAATGAKYFFIHTNYDSSFRETNSANNLSVSTVSNVSAAVPNDLVVSAVQLPDTVFTLFGARMMYTVPNNGTGTTAGSWTDSLFFGCSPAFNRSTATFLTKRTQTRSVPAGGSYSDTFSLVIPKFSFEVNTCFPETAAANAYFWVKTNADTGTYEGTNVTNNLTGSGARVLANPLIDFAVTGVSATPDTVTVGRAFPVRWTVRNVGYNPARYNQYGYYEGIYLSPDSVLNGSDALAGSFLRYTTINRGDSVIQSGAATPPALPSGNYYLLVKTNYNDGHPAEKNLANNVNLLRKADGSAKMIYVLQTALPDLVDSILSAPAAVAVGQPVTVIRRITNKGVGPTYPGSFSNRLLLSVDFSADNNGDWLLSSKTTKKVLLPGESVTDTLTGTVPMTTVPGNYVLIDEANERGEVIESNATNNLGFSQLSVYVPPAADLTVTDITAPDTVYLGYTLDTVRWTVKNASPNKAKGKTADGVYLSAGTAFDSTATLLGIRQKDIDMQPLQTDTVRLAPPVTTLPEGLYNLFVKTDLRNNIVESDKENNSGLSVKPVYVKAKELTLNVAETTTLYKTDRYYKLRIPDSLIGATILVTLKTPDSLTVRNEMFIGAGYVPSVGRRDYQFEIPNYGNQQIVMTSVTDSVYYIDLRCASASAAVQNITLKAAKLPFAILNVNTASGGNIGNVTAKISGSLFTTGMTATLSKGATTIAASAVYFTNSTTVYATFNLQGKPLGMYDVVLTKLNAATATLVNGFSVVAADNGGLITGSGSNTGSGNGANQGCDPGAPSGLNSQLVVELVVPKTVLLQRPVVIQVNYSNPTNYDIPAQTRVLYSEAGMKMAFSRAGVPTGTTALYLELTESGGPPGIIRAGGSGSILIYTVAPHDMPQNRDVLFKLK